MPPPPKPPPPSFPGAIGVGADVGDPAAVRAMVARVEAELGPVDVYCSNAGVATAGDLGDDAAWDLQLARPWSGPHLRGPGVAARHDRPASRVRW